MKTVSTAGTAKEKQGDICPHQMAILFDNWLRRLIQSPKKIVGDYIKEGDTVIDVGCGPGYFSIDMAKMVGESGKVIAVDIQAPMLEQARKQAGKHQVLDRMEFHQCQSGSIGLEAKADFILAFYMIHETPNPKGFLAEMREMLNAGGKLLVVEPKMHVSPELYAKMLKEADEVGLKVVELPSGKGGRSVLFTV